MGATSGKLEVLSLEKSTIESVRNCPPEILARIASFLGQRECKRIGEFLPEMEDAFEIAIDMNWEWCCFLSFFFLFITKKQCNEVFISARCGL